MCDAGVLAFAALGSNLPWRGLAPQQIVVAGLLRLAELGRITARSGLWRSRAWPDDSQPAYVNAVVRIQVTQQPHALLAAFHNIEASLGRVRDERWGNRTLDLDLIDYGGQVLGGAGHDDLVLPHPRAHDRAFVLAPLREVAPLWRHPALGTGVDDLLAAIPSGERTALRRMAGN